MLPENSLNDAQKKAVLHKKGALLILAGAGAGKTRVITHRIAELIRSGINPGAILAVTFTNKAASEMRSRVLKLISEDLSLSPYDTPKTLPYIGTFHAVSLEIIKTFHEKAGLPRRFSIFDRSDSVRALKEAISEAGFDPKQLEPRRVLSIMGRHKGNAVDLDAFRERYVRSYIDEAVAEVWERYEKILAKEKALDFDDILLRAYHLVARNPEVREYFERAWQYVHVDEYQDTNRVQYELVRLLSKKSGNIAAVGDIDQNIYSWRGASIEFIMNFEQDFPDAEIVVLAENYRSTKTILAAANDAIEKNIQRKEKELYTKNADGEKITVAGFYDETEEARYVAKEAKYLSNYGVKHENIAVLYRANFQSRILEEAFLKENVPYQVLGTRFFERKEVKDAVSYIKLALNPDSSADFARAIGTPSRGIGKVTLVKVVNGKEEELPASARKKIQDFRTLLARIQNKIETAQTSEAIKFALHESGLWNLYAHGTSEDTERLENLKELVTVATKYDHLAAPEGIEKLIEEAALQSDQDELKEKKVGVKLMTIHAAKGLEFERVFITGLEEGLFPHERDEAEGVDHEEERRLFYVALTRAEKKVYLTHAATRRIFGTRSINTPSEFVVELDPALVEVVPFVGNYHEETID
ncbi:UvrD-helicase domain-containing protein [Patescibacteria group bacterium]|nr:UvrD-helicase domain-containing protein [Patescibacteria group bacterium]